MSISISKIIEKTKNFQEEQLKSFKLFIDTSKQLKSAIKSQKDEAGKDLEDMEKLVTSLSNDIPANDKNPMEILEQDPAYSEALKTERILEAGFNKPKQTEQYMNKRQDKVTKLLNQGDKVDE
jgi:hypothetical protein